MREHLRRWPGGEGVLFVGKAQEKARVVRSERREHEPSGSHYVQLVHDTAMVNHYYVYLYLFDDDFGPMFVKFCSYFPYTARLCVNGHEYVKRQLAKRGVGFEALDNGILSCADPSLAQRLADELSAERIDDLLRKWLRRLPHPFARDDRAAGIRYEVSVLQAEFALTQVLDRPVQGRVFFEETIRENLERMQSAIRFCILTAARRNMVAEAKWSEIDMDARTCTVPAARMKLPRDHRIPLSHQAVALLRRMRPLSADRVFGVSGSRMSDAVTAADLPSDQPGRHATLHGWRSTFKDWCRINAVDEVLSEYALAHVEGSATVAAYARDDLVGRRRELMQAWGNYVAGTGRA